MDTKSQYGHLSVRDGRSLRVAKFFWLSRWGGCIPCIPYGVSAPAILDGALNCMARCDRQDST
jgi:hypothetical protein